MAADAAGYGDAACGRDGEFYAAARLHLIRHGFAVPPVSLRVGRFAVLNDTPPACHSTPRTPRGEGFGRVAFSTAPLKGKANEDVSFDDISLVNGWYANLLYQHLDIHVAFRDTFW